MLFKTRENVEVLIADNMEDAAAVATMLVEVFGNPMDYLKYCSYEQKDDGSVAFTCKIPWMYKKKFYTVFEEVPARAIETSIF